VRSDQERAFADQMLWNAQGRLAAAHLPYPCLRTDDSACALAGLRGDVWNPENLSANEREFLDRVIAALRKANWSIDSAEDVSNPMRVDLIARRRDMGREYL
jgi:hypothetical protein